MRYFVQVGGRAVELEVEQLADGNYRVRDAQGRELKAELLAARAGSFLLSIAGQTIEAQPHEQEVRLAGERYGAFAESERDRAANGTKAGEARGAKELVAPMPGRIVRVSCAVGDQVEKGTPLVVIEAMKMQNELNAKQTATVRAVHVTAGATVERGALLVELD